MISHSQFKQAITSWMNQPERDLTVDLPSGVRTALEKHFLRMFFHADDAADSEIARLQAWKQLILALKALYPEVQP